MTLKLAVGVQHLLSKGCDISCDKLQLHVKHNVFVFCLNEVAIPVADSEMSIVSVILKGERSKHCVPCLVAIT